MTQNRNELKEKLAAAIEKSANSFTDGYCPTPYEMTHMFDCFLYAEACLSAIEQSGCTICPNEPTERQLFEADRSDGGFASLQKIRSAYSAMLSSSPFKTQGEKDETN